MNKFGRLFANDMDAEQEESTLGRVGPDSINFFTDTVSWRGVAPTVPSVAVSCRCAALRTVWLKAAMTVNNAQSHEESSIN